MYPADHGFFYRQYKTSARRPCTKSVSHRTATVRITSPNVWRWDLAEWSERCASIPKITGSNRSGGSELTFRSDLLLTDRGGCT
jgi:hypothetical protein